MHSISYTSKIILYLICCGAVFFLSCIPKYTSASGSAIQIDKYHENPNNYPNFIYQCNEDKVSLSELEVKFLNDFDSLVQSSNVMFIFAKRKIADTSAILFRFTFYEDSVLQAGTILTIRVDTFHHEDRKPIYDTYFIQYDTLKTDTTLNKRFGSETYFLSSKKFQQGIIPKIIPTKVQFPQKGINLRGDTCTYLHKIGSNKTTPTHIKKHIYNLVDLWNKYSKKLDIREMGNEGGTSIFTKHGRYSKIDKYYSSCNPEEDKQKIIGKWEVVRY